MWKVCSNLTAAAEVSPEISITVYSPLTSLLDLVRNGKLAKSVDISAMEILSRATNMSSVEALWISEVKDNGSRYLGI